MKPAKILGLAVAAALTLMVLLGAADASAGGVLCEAQQAKCEAGKKWAVKQVLDFILEPGSSVKVEPAEGETTLVSCPVATFEFELVENPDAKLGEATGRNAGITWGADGAKCSAEMNTTELGDVKISNIANTFDGTVRTDAEIKVTINSGVIGKCIVAVKANEDIGKLTEGKTEAGHVSPTLLLNAVGVKAPALGDPCGALWPEKVRITGTYGLTRPEDTTLAVTNE